MRKRFFTPATFIFAVLLIAGVFVIVRIAQKIQPETKIPRINKLPLKEVEDNETAQVKEDVPLVSIVATGLDTPWAITFLPGGGMLVSERKGTVRLVDSNGDLQESPVAQITNVRERGEGGLHGIALHPDFLSNNFVYIYYTYSGSSGNTLNRVVRMFLQDNRLVDEKIIVDAIPGASNHNGGRIKFGPDGYLYITTGDAQVSSSAQDTSSLAGKILRVNESGNQAPGNPFNNRVYSYGHRNPQGITWDSDGQFWQTEHGPSGFETGNDEFNKIEFGKNYGWPEIRGTQTREGMVAPIIESGRSETWAPASLAYLNERFFFTGLRGQTLYEVTVNGNAINLKRHFKNEFGRLREVIAGPDGMLYITTSNRDGRGIPKPDDDKILRINPDKL